MVNQLGHAIIIANSIRLLNHIYSLYAVATILRSEQGRPEVLEPSRVPAAADRICSENGLIAPPKKYPELIFRLTLYIERNVTQTRFWQVSRILEIVTRKRGYNDE